MQNTKFTCLLLAIILVASTPIIIYLNSVFLLVFNHEFYILGFQHNNVYAQFSDKSIPPQTAKQLVNYFKSDSLTLPDIDIFNTAEKEHLLDVKLLIKQSLNIYFSLLFVTLFCIFIIYKINKKILKRIFKTSALLTIVVTFLIIISSIKFNWLFVRFHLVFFPQGNWMFPYDSNLIKLFPKSFFVDGFILIIALSLIQSFLLLLLSSLPCTKKLRKGLKILIKKQKIFK